MKYQQYKERIESELNNINWLIDDRIARGLSYRREARRHKELLREVRRTRRQPFFTRFAAYVSLF